MLAFESEVESGLAPAPELPTYVPRPPIVSPRPTASWAPRPAKATGNGIWRLGAIVLAVVLIGVYVFRPDLFEVGPFQADSGAAGTAPAVPDASVTVDSSPQGVLVMVDGQPRGVTPLELALAPGRHDLTLQNGAVERTAPLVVQAGATASHFVDFAPGPSTLPPVTVPAVTPPATPPPPPTRGSLDITSDPPGATVTVDGEGRGVTPLKLSAVRPGTHRVQMTNGESTVDRTITVTAGATATVVASLKPLGPPAGWLSVNAPFELDILESGRIVGTTDAERVMLPAGSHALEFVNVELEFRSTATVDVTANDVVSTTVVVPKGTFSVNATPWADIWLDGRHLGTTPLANLPVDVGYHELRWRHPELGERTRRIAVTAHTPTRIGLDFR